MHAEFVANAIPEGVYDTNTDTRGVPDTFPGCFGFWAVEVKNSLVGSMAILNALLQIKRYANNESKYYINSIEINPSGFLIATQNSIRGHFYDDEEIKPADKGRQWAINLGQVPKREYDKTKDAIRLIWRFAKEEEISYPMGGLLSNVLNDEFSIAPLLQYKKGKQQMFEVWS